MAEQELDRSESASPFKLKKAREQGKVPRSMDISLAVVFAVMVVYFNAQGLEMVRQTLHAARALLLTAAATDMSMQAVGHLLQVSGRAFVAVLTPFLATLLIAAVLSCILQTGVVFAPAAVKPDWSRLDLMAGLKKFFSLRLLVDLARNLIKLAVFAGVTWHALKSVEPQLFHIALLSPMDFIRVLLAMMTHIGFQYVLALGLIALLDFAWTRREFARQMRMSKREVKDEHKQREGDPRIRSRIRALRREMMKRAQSVGKTRDADVVITNPTHIAIAIQYRHGEMASPRILAKGAGPVAAVMRLIASRHQIPVVQNRAVARALYKQVDINGYVPSELYNQVAKIIVWVFAMRKAREARKGGALQS